MSDVWKDILGYEGAYQVSNLGRVRSLDRVIYRSSVNGSFRSKGRILKLQKFPNKYLFVQLGRSNVRLVHRLVAEAFIKGDKRKQVNHINGIRTDNKVSNLEWLTCSDNHKHSYKILIRKKHSKIIAVKLIKGEKTVEFSTQSEAAKYLHVAPASIQSAFNRNHLCCGWRVSHV